MKQKSISFLIGAGFSAPMGYPVGGQLNEHLVACTGEKFSFHTDGTLMISSNGTKPSLGYKTSYDLEFDFCVELIKLYRNMKGRFDYELFYDFLKEDAANNEKVKRIAAPYLKGYSSLKDLLYHIDNIYCQMIDFYLTDKDGNRWYDNASHICGPYYPGYTGILNCLHQLLGQYILNIHSLNHDLLLERFNYSDWIAGEICDGFEELGSPFYGDLYVNNCKFKARLARYTGVYDKKIRQYKLHGSRNYGIFYGQNSSIALPENYVQLRYGMRFGDIYKEMEAKDGKLQYEHCFINYHADFLTGTTSKIQRYKEPLLYKKLFSLFTTNLNEAEKLIIIGYGGRDMEINRIILRDFDHRSKPVIFINPYPNPEMLDLLLVTNGKLIDKHLSDVNITDIT